MGQSGNYNFYFILFILLLASSHFLIAQSTSIDFQTPNEVCHEQYFDVQNISVNYHRYQFDFCEGDLSLTPTLASKEETAFNVPIGTSLIESNGKWYGFVCSMNDNAIFRLDFGASLTNKSPELVKLNNTGGMLNAPQDIKMIEYEGEFFAFIYNRVGNQLIRLNFGSSIENLNVSSDALVAGNGFVNGGLDVIFDGKQWTASLTFSNYIRLINLGDSPKNVPGFDDIITTNPIDDINGIGDISFIQDNEHWYGFVVGFNSKTIHRLDFGDSLFIDPLSHKLTSFELGSLQPRGLSVKKEKGDWVLFSVTQQGNFLRFNLGTSINNVNPVYTDLGKLGGLSNTYKLDIVNSSSRWVALTTSWNSNKYHLIEFPQADCPFDLEYSDKTTTLKALKQGSQYITLYGTDDKGISKSVTKTVMVKNQKAPKIEFNLDNICNGQITTFTAQNLTPDQTLTSLSWDFGDGTTATGTEVTHQYTSPGTYKVRLTVESDGGCGNFIEKEVNIYEAPDPEFSFPAGVLCTNGAITFENSTPGEYNDDVTWTWDFGDGTTSAEKEPSHIYATGGTKTVTLKASIPGCEATVSHELEVIPGPSVDFSASNLCLGEEVQFSNLSTGSSITDYAWDFGNGEASTAENPTVTYAAAGTYEVSLTVNNTSGCSNTLTKSIVIHSLPEVDFDHALVCSGSPTPFEDRSTVEDGSISSWLWNFGDDGTTSTEKNPVHIFAEPGTYEVKLIVSSSWGCIDSTKQTVLVKSSPKANFVVERGCPGTTSRFIDTSTIPEGDQIVKRVWVINSASFFSENPEIKFSLPGTYSATLTVTSSNGCQSSITREVIIDPLPAPDFTFTNACVGELTAFTDLSQAFGDDEIIDWQWQFGNVATSNDQQPEVSFTNAGDVPVTLTVTTDRGCTVSIHKTVTISALPSAAFTTQTNLGAPPLRVNFKNNTSGAVSYQWLFGDPDNSTSTEENPAFVYTTLGEYEAKLIATNAAGCTDTASMMIKTLIPKLEVALEQLNTFNTSGDLQLVLKITNKGSIRIEDMDITLDLGGQLKVKEHFSGSIAAGESVNYPLSFEILKENMVRVPYVCASLSIVNTEYSEENLEDNSACKDIAKEFVLLTPFPNPVNGTFYVNFVMPEKAPVRLLIADMLGETVVDKTLQDAKVGYNSYDFDFSSLTAGMYVIKVIHGGQTHLRKVVVR